MEIGEAERGTHEEGVVGRQRFERRQRRARGCEAGGDLGGVARLAAPRLADGVDEDLTHQWPVDIGIDDAEDLVLARESTRRRGLQRRPGKGAVDVAGDGAGLVEREAIVDQRRHAAERVQPAIVGRWIGREWIHLDEVVGHAFLGEGEPGRPDVDARAVSMEDDSHAGSLAFR